MPARRGESGRDSNDSGMGKGSELSFQRTDNNRAARDGEVHQYAFVLQVTMPPPSLSCSETLSKQRLLEGQQLQGGGAVWSPCDKVKCFLMQVSTGSLAGVGVGGGGGRR